MPCLVQQAVEKIDRTRGLAGKTFHTLLHARFDNSLCLLFIARLNAIVLPRSKEGKTIPGVPCRDFLVDLFPEEILIAREIDKSLNPIERKDGNNKTVKNDDPRAAAIEKIKEIACRNASQAINWNVESDTYPRFVFRSRPVQPYTIPPFSCHFQCFLCALFLCVVLCDLSLPGL